jgi:hypothetical protein
MKYVRDTTGRFSMRPYYQEEELDQECEQVITQFMQERCGGLALPIPTDVLTKLIERDTEDLDLYADLSSEGTDVQGVTDFIPGHKPCVRIAFELSEKELHAHRLRTTLTHEYGHVKFHGFLWDRQLPSLPLFPELALNGSPRCKREAILGAFMSDWMEWQAGYVCGALLMPVQSVRQLVVNLFERYHLYGPLQVNSSQGQLLIDRVATCFDVSHDAARVRLLQLKHLTNDGVGRSFFS